MATRALKPKDDSMLAGWESMPERAPSIMREDQPVVVRFLGLVGVFLFAVGVIALIVPAFNFRYIVGPTAGLVFGTTGLALILLHAFADHDVQYRRLYAFAAVVLMLIGVVLRVLPAGRAGLGGWFLPYGVPAIALGYLLMLAVLRYETDGFWRTLLLRMLGLFGFAMITLGAVVGLANPDFVAGEGILLMVLGVFLVGGFIGQQDPGSDTAYASGLALGAIAVLTFAIAAFRSLAASTFFIPAGISLMGMSVVYFALALGVCSDAPFVVLVRRELASFFFSPVAYLVLFGSTMIAAVSFLMFWETLSFYGMREPIAEPIVAHYFFSLIPVVALMVIVPALTMRLLSEEKRSGTLEMLLTAPVNESTIVLSKFAAALVFWMLTWLPYFLFLVGLRVVAGEEFDYRPLLSFALALAASGAGFVAMGLFFSALTRNQVIAAVLTFVGMTVHMSFYLFSMMTSPGSAWQEILQYASFLDMWRSFLEGNFAPRFLIFHLSAAVLFLYLSAKVLEARKWK